MKKLALSVFLMTACLAAAEVTGRWSGTLSITSGDGQSRQEPVLLILKQEGAKVTGTGGRDDADRHQVMEGKIDGDKVILDVEAGSAPIRLELKVTGDDMSGEASRTRGDGSKQTAKIAVKRAKP
jgi:hypothetical protein